MPLFGSGKKAVVPVDGTAAGADALKQPVPEDSVTFDTFKNKQGPRLGRYSACPKTS